MALERHAAGAAVEVPGTAPPQRGDTPLRCVVCRLPATSERRPPLCADCQESPFSTPESQHSHREWFGPPCGHIYNVADTPIKSRGVEVTLRLAVVWVPKGGTLHFTVNADGAVLNETVEIDSHPWREVVLFHGHRLWIETQWSGAFQDLIPTTHDLSLIHI